MKKKSIILSILMFMLLLSSCGKQTGGTLAQGHAGQVTPTNTAITDSPQITITPTSTPTLQPSELPTATPSPLVTKSPESTPEIALPELSNTEKAAKEILDNMTLEEKIGQLFFVRCRKDTGETDIQNYDLGGYILFADDFKDNTKTSMKEIIRGYQDNSKIPLLIGVDEEGGTVNRVSKYPAFRSTPFQSPQELYQNGGFDLIEQDTIEKAELLKSLGINVNLAPVGDVSTNSKDFIYKRSFGQNAQATSDYVATVISIMNSEQMGSTLKHFPGYGDNVDTHTGIAIDERSYESFENSDFLPFEAGIKAGVGSILVSHNIVESMDENYPASLSLEVHNILREELGFDGVIMTDDLSMDAIKKYTDDNEAAVLAILAGNDLIVASNFDVQIPAVVAAVNDNIISVERIDESVMRVLMWKSSIGIIF